jgi:hypothetical protein
MAKVKKTEHAGAKNGGGHWGSRAEAKAVSKKARREASHKLVKKFKYKNANKHIGILIRGLNGEPFYFRIYGKNGTFKDFDILHHDVRIQILDDSAEFLESADGEECFLDYSREVLGQETKYVRSKNTPRKRK